MEEPKSDIKGENIFARKLSGVPKAPIRTTDTIIIVTFPSIIALREFLNPLSIAPSMVLPFLNSSFMRSDAITLQSTPTPTERIIPWENGWISGWMRSCPCIFAPVQSETIEPSFSIESNRIWEMFRFIKLPDRISRRCMYSLNDLVEWKNMRFMVTNWQTVL